MNKNSKRKLVHRRKLGEVKTGKGNPTKTHGAREAAGRKPWRGAGDPLKRGKPDYKLVTPDPQGARYARTTGTTQARSLVQVLRPVIKVVVDLITPTAAKAS